MDINFEKIVILVSNDLKALGLEREQSYDGNGFPPKDAFYFIQNENVLSVFFSIMCQRNSILSLKNTYQKVYGENFNSHIDKDDLLHNVEFRFFK